MSVVLYIVFIRYSQDRLLISPLIIFIIYLVIALTDLIDGILARRLNMVTELGKELDPLTDKVLVFLMLFAFYRIGILPLWVIIPIFLRDIFVNYLRKRSKLMDIHFTTSNLAKAKTAVQMIFIGFVLAIPAALSMDIPNGIYDIFADYITGSGIVITMFVVMLFTVYTGIDYYIKFRKSMHEKQ